jgi:hypothetical protein
VDLSLDKKATARRKRLKQVALFELTDPPASLLMNVNKPGELLDSVVPALFTAT